MIEEEEIYKIKYKNKPLEVGNIIYQNNNDFLCFLPHSEDESAVYHYNFVTKKCRKLQKNEEVYIRVGKTNYFLQL